VAPTGKVAVVSLFLPSNLGLVSSEELSEEIRRKIEASSLSSTWIVDRVTVLDEDGTAVRILSSGKSNKVAVA
jgi:hypothetical protein